jgi:hypothetical protein
MNSRNTGARKKQAPTRDLFQYIPDEILELILSYILVRYQLTPQIPNEWLYPSELRKAFPHSVLRVSKRFYNIATHILYQKNTFQLRFLDVARGRGPSAFARKKILRLEIDWTILGDEVIESLREFTSLKILNIVGFEPRNYLPRDRNCLQTLLRLPVKDIKFFVRCEKTTPCKSFLPNLDAIFYRTSRFLRIRAKIQYCV